MNGLNHLHELHIVIDLKKLNVFLKSFDYHMHDSVVGLMVLKID